MSINYGSVQKYQENRGFGFVTSTLQQSGNTASTTFFHINKFKHKYPQLYCQLCNGYIDIEFWYNTENTVKGEQVSEVWLDLVDVPNPLKEGIVLQIEHCWLNTNCSPSILLDKITVEIAGIKRRDDLRSQRTQLICEQQKTQAEEQRRTLTKHDLVEAPRLPQTKMYQVEERKQEQSKEVFQSKPYYQTQSVRAVETSATRAQTSPTWTKCSWLGSTQMEFVPSKATNLVTEKMCSVVKSKPTVDPIPTYPSLNTRSSRQTNRQTPQVDKTPERVFIGMPEHLIDRVLWVSQEHRTHPLSRTPGGFKIVVEYHDGRAFGYDRIKSPSAYIRKFFTRIVEYGKSDFTELDEGVQLTIAKIKVVKFYAKKDNRAFEEVWNSETSTVMPWKSLEKFENKYR